MKRAYKIYTPEYYQRIHELEEQKYWWSCGMTEIAASMLDKYIGKGSDISILDAGCGTGFFMDWLRRYAPKSIIGVDISMHALEFSRCRHSTVYQASVVNLPFSDASFDLIAAAAKVIMVTAANIDRIALGRTIVDFIGFLPFLKHQG